MGFVFSVTEKDQAPLHIHLQPSSCDIYTQYQSKRHSPDTRPAITTMVCVEAKKKKKEEIYFSRCTNVFRSKARWYYNTQQKETYQKEIEKCARSGVFDSFRRHFRQAPIDFADSLGAWSPLLGHFLSGNCLSI